MVTDAAPFKPMRVFPKETFRAPRRELEGTSVPSARSFGSFSAAGQKMNIKNLNQRALCAARCGSATEFQLARVFAGHIAAGFLLFVHFFAPRKETNQRNEPREGIPSGSLLGRLHPLRGGGIGWVVACVRYHVARRRRPSIMEPLGRLCEVHPLHWLTPWSMSKAFEAKIVSSPRVRNGGRQPIEI